MASLSSSTVPFGATLGRPVDGDGMFRLMTALAASRCVYPVWPATGVPVPTGTAADRLYGIVSRAGSSTSGVDAAKAYYSTGMEPGLEGQIKHRCKYRTWWAFYNGALADLMSGQRPGGPYSGIAPYVLDSTGHVDALPLDATGLLTNNWIDAHLYGAQSLSSVKCKQNQYVLTGCPDPVLPTLSDEEFGSFVGFGDAAGERVRGTARADFAAKASAAGLGSWIPEESAYETATVGCSTDYKHMLLYGYAPWRGSTAPRYGVRYLAQLDSEWHGGGGEWHDEFPYHGLCALASVLEYLEDHSIGCCWTLAVDGSWRPRHTTVTTEWRGSRSVTVTYPAYGGTWNGHSPIEPPSVNVTVPVTFTDGDYEKFVNSDNWWSTGRLEHREKRFETASAHYTADPYSVTMRYPMVKTDNGYIMWTVDVHGLDPSVPEEEAARVFWDAYASAGSLQDAEDAVKTAYEVAAMSGSFSVSGTLETQAIGTLSRLSAPVEFLEGAVSEPVSSALDQVVASREYVAFASTWIPPLSALSAWSPASFRDAADDDSAGAVSVPDDVQSGSHDLLAASDHARIWATSSSSSTGKAREHVVSAYQDVASHLEARVAAVLSLVDPVMRIPRREDVSRGYQCSVVGGALSFPVITGVAAPDLEREGGGIAYRFVVVDSSGNAHSFNWIPFLPGMPNLTTGSTNLAVKTPMEMPYILEGGTYSLLVTDDDSAPVVMYGPEWAAWLDTKKRLYELWFEGAVHGVLEYAKFAKGKMS